MKQKLAVLSNMNLDLLSQQLSLQANVYTPPGYGNWAKEILDRESGLYRFDPGMVFIIPDAEEMLRGTKELAKKITCLQEYGNFIRQAIKNNPGILFFVSTLDIPPKKLQGVKETREEPKLEKTWYDILENLTKNGNFYIFDLKKLIEENGRKEFYSSKLWYLSGMKYSMKALTFIRQEIERIIRAHEGKRKKCLILDLDNTLWGGVIGEDGLDGIELSEFKEGGRYKDFQQRIKEMKEQGVVLAISSKNNPEDVEEVFREHPHMVLKEEDFVSLKINWEPKYRNIREICDELNIGMDSLVFIDDSPVERESVGHQLPGVMVPDFPMDTSQLEAFIIKIYRDYFFTLRGTREDRDKTNMYRQEIARKREMEKAPSFEDFLKSLDTRIKIWPVREEDIPRASQLTQKTNQFNLTTRRYTEKDIRGLAGSPGYLTYIASVEDKFGDNGKVAVAIVKKINDKLAELDTFLMSCRVMGKNVEDQIIDYIENQLSGSGIEEFKTFYFPTRKNQPAADFFDRLGYGLTNTDEAGKKQYRLVIKEKPVRKSYACLIGV